MVLLQQRDDHIHHGEAAAHQKHPRVGLEIGRRRRAPGIGDIAAGIALRRKIADGQRHGIDVIAAAAAGLEAESLSARMQGDRLIGDEKEPVGALRAPDLASQDMLDIGAIELARGEGQAILADADLGPFVLGQGAQPVEEMIRLIGERAHIARAHVQEMMGIAGRIGEAATEARAALDEIDAIVGRGAAQQMDRQQRSAEAGTDDGDPSTSGIRHEGYPSLAHENARTAWPGGRPRFSCIYRAPAS